MSDYVDFYTIILALTSAYIVKTAISGVFLERLHRRACTRDCGIYYRKWGDCERSSEKIWDKQEYGAQRRHRTSSFFKSIDCPAGAQGT